MRQRTDSLYCWLTIVITSLALSLPLIHGTDQIISDNSEKELLAKTHSKSTQENLIPTSDVRTRLSKRASFMPARGKKEDDQELNPNVNEKKASGFLPMRGRKDYFTDQSALNWRTPNVYGIDIMDPDFKRAGFMPMRGRKNSDADSDVYGLKEEDVYQSELDSVKRSSFMPMRGRKDDFNTANNYGQDEYPMLQPYYPRLQIGRPNWMEGEHINSNSPEVEKKANAFFGARGKRWADSSVDNINHVKDEKRSVDNGHHGSHNENFFATRG